MGDPGQGVYAYLKEYQASEWQPFAFGGGHFCNLCLYEPSYSHRNFFIPGIGVTYAAPEGILHYVACHRYHPPQEFIDALLNSPRPDSAAYFACLRANGWAEWLARPYEATPEEIRQEVEREIIQADGNAICATINAFRKLHDRLPAALDEALGAVVIPDWEYIIEPSGDYLLKTSWETSTGKAGMMRRGTRGVDDWAMWS
jgi:hypothetical protein